jgi:hypothetical protein
LALAVVTSLAAILAALPVAARQTSPAAPAEQTAGQKYKNVQVLKDMPVSEFDDAMVYMSAATGQNCEGCHVRTPEGVWQHEKDDKDHKTTARTMLTMTQAINAQHFKGEQRVMCTTCHSGRREPLATTPLAQVMTADQLAAAAARAAAGPRPQPPTETVDQILDKYLAALGGRDAVARVRSRLMTGTVTTRAGQTVPFTVQEKAGGLFRSDAVVSAALTVTKAFDGKSGWIVSGKDAADYAGVELGVVSRSGELGLALDVKNQLSRMTVGRYEKIDGVDVISVNGRSAPNVAESLYFDRSTGLLVRRIARLSTVMGQIPIQMDFADYRAVEGVKVPYQVRQTTWDAVMTAKFTAVTLNAPIDDARFRR